MKRNTIKWKFFKYNLIIIIMLIGITTVVFNIVIRIYIERDIMKQLNIIAQHTEKVVLHSGPEFFPFDEGIKPPTPPNPPNKNNSEDNFLLGFYLMLDRALKDPLSMLNVDYILLNNDNEIITSPYNTYIDQTNSILNLIKEKSNMKSGDEKYKYVNFSLEDNNYVAILQPVSNKNDFGLGWIIIYSSLEKVNELQLVINLILFIILILSAIITAIFSSLVSKKVSEPFSSLNRHIKAISERNFENKIHLPIDDELQELVNNINLMSEKLKSYDQTQKRFLQNASHEFRTPLMSVQSYAEGIKYNVVDANTAANIILEETKQMTHLVEDLLYLSKLDTLDEKYKFVSININDLIKDAISRINGISSKNNIVIDVQFITTSVNVFVDKEKILRAINNVLSNCIRYANKKISIHINLLKEGKISIQIKDDGPGIDKEVLPNIFERFYKGKNGNFGLGMAISYAIIKEHKGKITAKNYKNGALFSIVLPVYNDII